jgi:hypothetical protein
MKDIPVSTACLDAVPSSLGGVTTLHSRRGRVVAETASGVAFLIPADPAIYQRDRSADSALALQTWLRLIRGDRPPPRGWPWHDPSGGSAA